MDVIARRANFALNIAALNLFEKLTKDDRIIIDSPKARHDIEAPTMFIIITILSVIIRSHQEGTLT